MDNTLPDQISNTAPLTPLVQAVTDLSTLSGVDLANELKKSIISFDGENLSLKLEEVTDDAAQSRQLFIKKLYATNKLADVLAVTQ